MARQLPDFIIIGAMKSATSTLHEQLARQPGIFMCTPKEPYFFSDDPVYAQGIAWYRGLFAAAEDDALTGESTTHYTKLPTYPQTITRMQQHAPDVKLIYVMRHPIDRLVSQYVHHWTEREVDRPIDEAIDSLPILVDYSRYSYQLVPYFAAFGPQRVLPVFFDRLRRQPQSELERIGRFLGYAGTPQWDSGDQTRNVSSERLRVSPVRDFFVEMPILRTLRKRLVPQALRDRVKAAWQMRERPSLSDASMARLTRHFDADLRVLGGWLGVELNCDNFKAVTGEQTLEWVAAPGMERGG